MMKEVWCHLKGHIYLKLFFFQVAQNKYLQVASFQTGTQSQRLLMVLTTLESNLVGWRLVEGKFVLRYYLVAGYRVV
jgi:hypothetical protein